MSTLAAAVTVLCAVLIVSFMGWLLKGEVTVDYILTGLVTAAIVAPASLATVSRLLRELAQQQQAVLANDVARAEAHLNLALESTDEGVLMVARSGRVLAVNQRFLDLCGIARAQVDTLGGPSLLDRIGAQTLDPETFAVQTRRIADSDAERSNTLHLRNGRVFERYTRVISSSDTPGRIWCFRDITAQAAAQAALAEREEIYRTIVTQASEAITLVDSDTLGFIEFNDAACETLGYSRAEFARLRAPDIQAEPEDESIWIQCLQTSADAVIARQVETRYRHQSGDVRHVLLSLKGIQLHGRRFAVAIWSDITERKQAEERLHLAASVFTHANEGIMITEADGSIIDVNDAFCQITGYSRRDVLGRNPRLLGSGRQDAEFYALMWQSLRERGHWSGEIWNRRKNGEPFAVMQTISAVRDAEGQTRRYVALFNDVTAVKEHEQQLEYIAHYDALTALPNRLLLADRLRQSMAQTQRRGQRLALAYLDLDGFKAVNDRYGHDTGDRVLVAVANRMKAVLREGDTLARLGGDEFVAILIDLAQVDACESMLRRLLAAASAPSHVEDLRLQVSASLGVSFYPQDDPSVEPDQLLRQADQAMYQAKLAGKNRYHLFDAEQDRSIRGRHDSLERIRRALDAREFVLHYQPKVNMANGAIIGVEALIRWQHPERGLLLPGSFLPEIEEHPLSVDVGHWVIRHALSEMSGWQRNGLAIPVSVNLSARQLQQSDFVAQLRDSLQAHPDLPATQLSFEVLETSALDDLARTSAIIHACQDLGIQFALDDFGTGYSSLAYLKRLPINLLKIDRSFVRDMLDDPDDLVIVESVLGLSNAFRRPVIAEGVETVEHGELLLRLGCELGQGYGIARPMPAHALPSWLEDWRPHPRWIAASAAGDAGQALWQRQP